MMILLQILVAFGVIFVAGMHYSLYQQARIINSLYWSLGLSVVGIYNLVSLIGYVADKA